MQEYRLVPVEEWERQYQKEDGIDFVDLYQLFWRNRIKIAKITGVFVLIGLMIALFSPVEYESSATLMPEAQSSQSQAQSLLQQYGGMLGISGSNFGQEGTIPPQLYPNIIESLPFQIELMNTPLRFVEYDTTVSTHNFFSDINSPSVFSYIKSYTIGLPGKVIGLFRNNDEDQKASLFTNANRDSVLSLSMDQMETVGILRDRLTVMFEAQSGVLTIIATMPDATAAAELGHAGIVLLKEYVREYRTQKAMDDLEFVKRQVAETKKRFEESQNRLAEFRDSNINIATAKARTQEQKLQSEYDLAFNLYNSLMQRLEQAKLTLQEETPVLTVLQPVSIPLTKSSPKRILIMIIAIILGFTVSLGWIAFKSWYHERAKK